MVSRVDVIRVTECRLCDSPDLDLVVSFTPTPPGDHYITPGRHLEPQPCYPLDVMVCRGCGAVQLADTVDPKLIYPEYLYTTSVSKGLDKHFQDYATSVVERLRPGLGAFVVDIGSNDGTLLKAFKAKGCTVFGIEPAREIALKSGVNVWCEFFSAQVGKELRTQRGAADIITANHIMANVADLHDFVGGVKHLLAKDGTFVFETGYWPAIMGGHLLDTIEHEHIHYFAVKPLERLFHRHGLKLMHVELNEVKGGSLRGYVQHEHMGWMDQSVWDALEGEAVFTESSHLSAWANRQNHLEQQIKAVIAQSDNEIWVGYGAAVGSTLQLYQFGLGEKLLCLVDANPAKHGRLSPGYHLRVTSPDELRAINPDRIVILAWRYAEMIQQQHHEFAGKFLTLLPEMKTS